MSEPGGNPARAFYDRISGVYDHLSDASEHAARERGLKMLAVREGERVLEIGYGTGHTLEELARTVGTGGAVAGIDISTGMRDVARKRLAAADLEGRVDLRVGEVPPLPWDDAAFDAVTLSFTLELFEDDTMPRVLDEIRRVLAPGGRIGVVSMAEPDDPRHESLLTHAYKWMHRNFPHIVDCRPIDAVTRLRDAGFDVREHVEMSMWTLPVVCAVGVAPA